MKKYQILSLLIVVMLSGCQTNETKKVQDLKEEVTIVVASDLHYLSPTLTDYGEYFTNLIQNSDGKLTHDTPIIISSFVKEMLELNPKVIILSGDLTLNGAYVSHHELVELLKPLTQAGINLEIIPGNHDIGGYAYTFDGERSHPFAAVDTHTFVQLYKPLESTNIITKDEKTLSYISEVEENLWLVMIDTNGNEGGGIYTKSSMAWLEESLELAQQKGITVIGVSHQNVLVHNQNFKWGYQIIGGDDIQYLFNKYHVQLNLSGHLHIQSIVEEGNVTEIATSSLVITPHQYGIIKITPNLDVTYSTQSIQTIPNTYSTYASFLEYSQHFFNITTKLKIEGLVEDLDVDDSIKTAMIDYGIELNNDYFTGNLKEKTAYEQGQALWEEYLPEEGFTKYFSSISEDSFKDMTSWSKNLR